METPFRPESANDESREPHRDNFGIAERLAHIRERVTVATRKAGRPEGSVRLLAVSKTKSVDEVRAAYQAGQRAFGENYVQELCAKAEALRDLPDIEWHVIGPLQRNKVKQVSNFVSLVHTVDRSSLAEELQKRASANGRVVRVLLEVNVSGESSKAGCRVEDAPALATLVRALPNVSLVGLMTVPPDTDDREQARPIFRKLRELRDRLGTEAFELSMGMSHDFEIAIEEGATIVRVGTAIFGNRS